MAIRVRNNTLRSVISLPPALGSRVLGPKQQITYAGASGQPTIDAFGGAIPRGIAVSIVDDSLIDTVIVSLDVAGSVLDKDLDTPPGAPARGDRYIVSAGAGMAAGAWATHDNELAEWSGTAWLFSVPTEGMRVWVEDEDREYTFQASGPVAAPLWVPTVPTSFSGGATTTDGTVTTLATITPRDGTVVTIEVDVAARRNDGTEAAGYKRSATFRRAAGVTTQIGATAALATHEDVAGWDCAFDISGADVRVRATGEAAKTIAWTCVGRLAAVAP